MGVRTVKGVSQLRAGQSRCTYAGTWMYVFPKCELFPIIAEECKMKYFSKDVEIDEANGSLGFI